MQHLGLISMILLIIAGLNAGLVALLGLDVVGMVLGVMPILVKIFYILVGVAAVYQLWLMIKART